MVAVLDIGNSFTHIGFYQNDRLFRKRDFSHTAASDRKIKKYLIGNRIKDAALSSVDPVKTSRYLKLLNSITGRRPMVINHRLCLGLRIGYYRPGDIGTDRIAAMVGARSRYQGNLIVLNFGTAITLDVVLESAYSPGGIIMPGIQTAINGLADNTALLRRFKPHWPKRLLGRCTRDCMQSGVLFGSRAMIDGLVKMIQKTYDRRFLIIATGGWSKTMKKNMTIINHHDPDLVLYGIYRIFQINARDR